MRHAFKSFVLALVACLPQSCAQDNPDPSVLPTNPSRTLNSSAKTPTESSTSGASSASKGMDEAATQGLPILSEEFCDAFEQLNDPKLTEKQRLDYLNKARSLKSKFEAQLPTELIDDLDVLLAAADKAFGGVPDNSPVVVDAQDFRDSVTAVQTHFTENC